jgi:hypothetical protein
MCFGIVGHAGQNRQEGDGLNKRKPGFVSCGHVPGTGQVKLVKLERLQPVPGN